jgi:hypothetical protein
MYTLSSITNHDKLYKDTYWGNFGSDCESCSLQIIQNRDDFATNYKLKKYVESMPQYIQSEFLKQGCSFDHGECYTTMNDTYVIISNPYCCEDEEYVRLGWIPYNNLYSNFTCTYVKEIPMRTKKNKHRKRLNILNKRLNGNNKNNCEESLVIRRLTTDVSENEAKKQRIV